jgi:hypothetical protein
MRLAILVVLLLAACVSQPRQGGTVHIYDVGQFQDAELENGLVVPMRFARVVFPDGVEGLAVDYVTPSQLGSAAVEAELPYVWWEAMPTLRAHGWTQGWVRALGTLDTKGPGPFKADAWRACLTADGETLWIHLDGVPHAKDREAGKRCA